MPGSPLRPSRAAFGPRYRNRRPVLNPEKEVGEAVFNLAFWQLAGLGVTGGAMTSTLLTAEGALVSSAESWDPDGSGTPPVVEHLGTGIYRVTYPASVPDETGAEQMVELRAAKAYPQTTADVRAVAEVGQARFVTVHVRNAAGTHVDAPVLVEAV